jgi:hypothetical protein
MEKKNEIHELKIIGEREVNYVEKVIKTRGKSKKRKRKRNDK